MLMTINRCIDYTKASKGMKLNPKHETIDLKEAIQFPIDCMRNFQDKISFALQPLASQICSHIITDKQWIQENLLCLLSNAVKYSTDGTINIRVFLTDVNPESHSSLVHYKPQLSLSSMQFSKYMESNKDNSCLHEKYSFGFSSVKDIENNHCDPTPRETDENPDDEDEKKIAYLQFEIEDTGIGLSEEGMKFLFTPFKQAQRLAGGTGLGLYSLAKRIEAINGAYGVRKRNDGQRGSVFWFTIPYRPDMISAKEALNPTLFSRSSLLLTTNSVIGLVQNHNNTAGSPRNMLNCPSASLTRIGHCLNNPACSLNSSNSSILGQENNKFHILIVDDALSIVKMMSVMLNRQGYTISTAENGAIALEKLEAKWKATGKGFDLILMDLQMPIMDGLEATRRIREMENVKTPEWMLVPSLPPSPQNPADTNIASIISTTNHQLIFGVSANSDHETTKDAFAAGIDDFLGKPFTIDNFNTRLMKFFMTPLPDDGINV
jgi:CheY-like chemotaxis protein